MRSALLLHGMPSKAEYYDTKFPCGSNSHWFPWIQKRLIVKDYQVWAPDIYHSFKPKYETWKKEVERYPLDENSLLIGHSCGGGFLLKWLSENSLSPRKVFLIAPWLDPTKKECPDFFECDFDRSLHERTQLTIYGSDNDHPEILTSVKMIREMYPTSTYREFLGYGHFCRSDIDSEQFPELLEDLLA